MGVRAILVRFCAFSCIIALLLCMRFIFFDHHTRTGKLEFTHSIHHTSRPQTCTHTYRSTEGAALSALSPLLCGTGCEEISRVLPQLHPRNCNVKLANILTLVLTLDLFLTFIFILTTSSSLMHPQHPHTRARARTSRVYSFPLVRLH